MKEFHLFWKRAILENQSQPSYKWGKCTMLKNGAWSNYVQELKETPELVTQHYIKLLINPVVDVILGAKNTVMCKDKIVQNYNMLLELLIASSTHSSLPVSSLLTKVFEDFKLFEINEDNNIDFSVTVERLLGQLTVNYATTMKQCFRQTFELLYTMLDAAVRNSVWSKLTMCLFDVVSQQIRSSSKHKLYFQLSCEKLLRPIFLIFENGIFSKFNAVAAKKIVDQVTNDLLIKALEFLELVFFKHDSVVSDLADSLPLPCDSNRLVSQQESKKGNLGTKRIGGSPENNLEVLLMAFKDGLGDSTTARSFAKAAPWLLHTFHKTLVTVQNLSVIKDEDGKGFKRLKSSLSPQQSVTYFLIAIFDAIFQSFEEINKKIRLVENLEDRSKMEETTPLTLFLLLSEVKQLSLQQQIQAENLQYLDSLKKALNLAMKFITYGSSDTTKNIAINFICELVILDHRVLTESMSATWIFILNSISLDVNETCHVVSTSVAEDDLGSEVTVIHFASALIKQYTELRQIHSFIACMFDLIEKKYVNKFGILNRSSIFQSALVTALNNLPSGQNAPIIYSIIGVFNKLGSSHEVLSNVMLQSLLPTIYTCLDNVQVTLSLSSVIAEVIQRLMQHNLNTIFYSLCEQTQVKYFDKDLITKWSVMLGLHYRCYNLYQTSTMHNPLIEKPKYQIEEDKFGSKKHVLDYFSCYTSHCSNVKQNFKFLDFIEKLKPGEMSLISSTEFWSNLLTCLIQRLSYLQQTYLSLTFYCILPGEDCVELIQPDAKKDEVLSELRRILKLIMDIQTCQSKLGLTSEKLSGCLLITINKHYKLIGLDDLAVALECLVRTKLEDAETDVVGKMDFYPFESGAALVRLYLTNLIEFAQPLHSQCESSTEQFLAFLKDTIMGLSYESRYEFNVSLFSHILGSKLNSTFSISNLPSAVLEKLMPILKFFNRFDFTQLCPALLPTVLAATLLFLNYILTLSNTFSDATQHLVHNLLSSNCRVLVEQELIFMTLNLSIGCVNAISLDQWEKLCSVLSPITFLCFQINVYTFLLQSQIHAFDYLLHMQRITSRILESMLYENNQTSYTRFNKPTFPKPSYFIKAVSAYVKLQNRNYNKDNQNLALVFAAFLNGCATALQNVSSLKKRNTKKCFSIVAVPKKLIKMPDYRKLYKALNRLVKDFKSFFLELELCTDDFIHQNDVKKHVLFATIYHTIGLLHLSSQKCALHAEKLLKRLDYLPDAKSLLTETLLQLQQLLEMYNSDNYQEARIVIKQHFCGLLGTMSDIVGWMDKTVVTNANIFQLHNYFLDTLCQEIKHAKPNSIFNIVYDNSSAGDEHLFNVIFFINRLATSMSSKNMNEYLKFIAKNLCGCQSDCYLPVQLLILYHVLESGAGPTKQRVFATCADMIIESILICLSHFTDKEKSFNNINQIGLKAAFHCLESLVARPKSIQLSSARIASCISAVRLAHLNYISTATLGTICNLLTATLRHRISSKSSLLSLMDCSICHLLNKFFELIKSGVLENVDIMASSIASIYVSLTEHKEFTQKYLIKFLSGYLNIIIKFFYNDNDFVLLAQNNAIVNQVHNLLMSGACAVLGCCSGHELQQLYSNSGKAYSKLIKMEMLSLQRHYDLNYKFTGKI